MIPAELTAPTSVADWSTLVACAVALLGISIVPLAQWINRKHSEHAMKIQELRDAQTRTDLRINALTDSVRRVSEQQAENVAAHQEMLVKIVQVDARVQGIAEKLDLVLDHFDK